MCSSRDNNSFFSWLTFLQFVASFVYPLCHIGEARWKLTALWGSPWSRAAGVGSPRSKKKHEMSRNESDFDPDICIHQSLNMRFLTKEWSERCWQGFSNPEFEGRNFSNAQTAGTWIFTIWWCLMIFESRYLDDLGHLFNKPSVRFALSIEGFQVQDLSLWTEEMQEQRLFLFQQSTRRVVFLWGKIL